MNHESISHFTAYALDRIQYVQNEFCHPSYFRWYCKTFNPSWTTIQAINGEIVLAHVEWKISRIWTSKGDMSSTKSWVAYTADCEFPIENLPYGVFHLKGEKPCQARGATKIGSFVVDLAALEQAGVFANCNLPTPCFSTVRIFCRKIPLSLVDIEACSDHHFDPLSLFARF